jgi:formate dehydrogenase major subunit
VDRLVEVAPMIGKSPLMVRAIEARMHGERALRSARGLLQKAVRGAKEMRAQSGPLVTRLKSVLGTRAPVTSPVPPSPDADKPAPVRSVKLSIVQTAQTAHVETPAPVVQAKAPAIIKPPVKPPILPTSEPSTDPASALSVARGVGSAAKDFHWLKENIPCQSACPAHTDIPAYLKAIVDGRYDEAYEINLRDNVFPGVMGRVCSRPCEAACRHGEDDLGEPVAICWSKRASADHRAGKPMVLPALASPTGKRVVVIGGGPAGLAAARNLALLGHSVVVLEQHARAGGMMVQDIPEFRLPREVVELEIEQIRLTGVEIRCGVALGRDVTLAELEAEYDAVILAAGTFRPNNLDLPGKEMRGIEHGMDFLLKVGQGQEVALGPNVLVIGGGFTAMDCARTAARLGANTVQLGEAPGGRGQIPALKLGAEAVRVLYRRSKEEMVITPGEVEDLQHEGMDIDIMVAPVAYLAGDNGNVRGMRFVRTQMGDTDASGRRRPEPIPGSEFELPATTVLLATGQFPDGAIVGESGKGLVSTDGWLATGAAHRTNRPKIFAAGDFATGARTLIDAIAHAKECALVVDEALMGKRRMHEVAIVEDAKATARTREMDAVPRRKMRLLPVLDRTLRAEVEQGFDRERATQETTRCYLCHNKMEIDESLCTKCDLCLNVKPRADCIIKVSAFTYDETGKIAGYQRATDQDKNPRIWINQADCIRCGACIDVCPDDAISLQKVSLRTVMAAKA